MARAVIVSEKDNVATLLQEVKAGENVDVTGAVNLMLVARQSIPRGHKIALKDFSSGEDVIKYGFVIGKTVCEIKRGTHVHIHNVVGKKTEGELR